MRLYALFIILFFAASPACSQGLIGDDLLCTEKARHEKRMAFRVNPNVYHGYEILYHRLRLKLDPRKNDSLAGSVFSLVKIFKNTDSIGFDFVAGMQVDSVKRGNIHLLFSRKFDVLYCHKPGQWQAGTFDSLTVYYHGKPSNGGGFGAFVRDNHQTGPVIHTLSEPHGAKFWWPCKQTLDDKIDSLDFYISTHKSLKAASNGLLVGSTLVDTTITYHWKHRYPIATYLVAMAVTNYQEYTDYAHWSTSSDSMPVLNYVFPQTLTEAKTSTKVILPILRFYDSLFGPYPFKKEKYGHAQFTWGGGMEHQTMSFMVNFSFDLQAHELGHQWFGDGVTCGSWEDLWLNEGFATYLTALCYDHFYNRPQFLDKMWWVRKAAISQNGGSVHARDTNNVGELFSGNLRYNKAAFMIHMLRDRVGDALFFATMKEYMTQAPRAYGFATTREFQKLFEKNCACDLDTFFNEWFEGEGFPRLYVRWVQSGKNLHLVVNQVGSSSISPFFHVKVPLLFRNKSGQTQLITVYPQSPLQAFDLTLNIAADTATFDPNVVVLAGDSVTGRNLDGGDAMYSVGPNPVRDILNIQKIGSQVTKTQLFNQAGQEVPARMVLNEDSGFGRAQLDLSPLPAGVYTLKIFNEHFVSLYKLIKY